VHDERGEAGEPGLIMPVSGLSALPGASGKSGCPARIGGPGAQRRARRGRAPALFTGVLLFVFVQGRLFPAGEDALSEYRLGNYERAAEICKRELEANPGNTESYIVLCRSLLRAGRYNEAAAYAEKAFALGKYDVRVIEILGEVNFYLGKNADALNYFREYVKLAPEGQRIETVYYFMGELYIRAGRFRYADIAFSTALHYLPGNARWWARAGYAREMSGEFREALDAYKKALALDESLQDAKTGINRTMSALQR